MICIIWDFEVYKPTTQQLASDHDKHTLFPTLHVVLLFCFLFFIFLPF